MTRWKIGALLLSMAMMLGLAGCSQGRQSNTAKPSPSAQVIESATASQSQVEQAPSPVKQLDTQPDPIEPDAPTVATPSSEAIESPQASDVGEVSPSQAPSASPKAAVETKTEPKIEPKPEKTAPAVDTIMLSIEGNAEWGSVLAAESIILATGDTVADVLKRTAKAHKLAYEIRGSGALTYIRGIDGLYEFDDGPTSGWKYRVNGVVADIGAGTYKLNPGDRVEWFYASEDEEAQEAKEQTS